MEISLKYIYNKKTAFSLISIVIAILIIVATLCPTLFTFAAEDNGGKSTTVGAGSVHIDFTDYNQIKRVEGKNNGANTASGFELDKTNGILKFKSEGNKARAAWNSTFLVDPNGDKNGTRLKNSTSYRLEIRYRFNQIEFPSDKEANGGCNRLGLYMGFSNSVLNGIWNECEQPTAKNIGGLWTKKGYYGTNTQYDGIGIYSVETADGAGDIWAASSKDENGWITGYLDFTTADSIIDKQLYMGFTTGCWGIYGSPTVEYEIDYIDIKENLPAESVMVDFSSYDVTSANASSNFTVDKANEKLNFNAKDLKNGIANSSFLFSPTGAAGVTRLKSETKYCIEMKYRFNKLDSIDPKKPLGVYIGFKDKLTDFVSATKSEFAGVYSKSGRSTVGSGITSVKTADGDGKLWSVSSVDADGWVIGYFTFTTPKDTDDKNVFIGFTYNSDGIPDKPDINYDIDYIDIYPEGASGSTQAPNTVVSEETYPASMRENTNAFSGIETSDEFKSGSSSFKFNSAASGDARIMLHDANKQAYKLSSLQQYMVSFWYKQKSATENTYVKFISAGEADITKAANTYCTIDIPAGQSGEWKQAVATFTAMPSRKSGVRGDVLYMTAESAGAEILIDDIEIRTSSTISFDTRGGETKASIKGAPGTKANLSDAIRAGYAFAGWYYDPELKQPATDVKFPTDKAEITLYAAWEVQSELLIMDFENAPYDNWRGPNFFDKAILNIEDGAGVNGSKGVKYNYTTDIGRYKMNERGLELYTGSSIYRVTNGNSYMMTFSYKLESTDAESVNVTAFTCQEHNSWNLYNKYTKNAFSIPRSDAGAGWKQGTIIFTADMKGDGSSIFFHIAPRTDANATVYFDDIKLYAIKEGQTFATYHIDDNTLEYAISNIGDKMQLPTPQREGYKFLGWYEDENFNTKVESEEYTLDKPKHFYAKWKADGFSAFVDFENYPSGWLQKPSSGDNTRFAAECEISHDTYVSPDTSIHIKRSFDNPSASQIQLYYKGEELVTDNDQYYLISFMYRVDEIKNVNKVTVRTAAKNNFWLNGSTCGSYTLNDEDVGKGWQQASLFVKTKINKDGNALFLGISGAKSYIDMYIDDVEITMFKEGQSGVVLECNDGSNPRFIVGNVGEKINFPEVTRGAYNFEGWYTDAALKNRYKGQYFGADVQYLYAKWKTKDVITVGFEDTYLDRYASEGMQLDSAFRSSEQASEGNYSLRIAKSDNKRKEAGAILTVDNVPLTVDNNQKYVLTYDYYIVKERPTGVNKLPFIYVSSGRKDNMWVGAANKSYKDEVTPCDYSFNTWCSAAYSFTTDFASEDGNALYIRAVDSSYCDLYIDNIKLIKVNNDDQVVLLDSFGTYGTELYVTAPKGQKVNLPTNVNKNGYTFICWSTDKTCKDRLPAEPYKVLKEERLYAVFAKNQFTETFETFDSYYEKGSYWYMDLDYELYNGSKTGNNRSNVHSGNWSLHHKGEDFHSTNVQLIKQNKIPYDKLVPECVYNVTMWVKMDNSKHTTGAIKLGSCSSAYYAWDVDGKYYNICKIADLADGAWHKVSFKYMATSEYLSLQIPGYTSIFIDDLTVSLIKGGTAGDCDMSLTVEEYVPKREGTYSDDAEKANREKIVDTSLYNKKETKDSFIEQLEKHSAVVIPIIAAVVLAAVFVPIICVKVHSKKKGAKK